MTKRSQNDLWSFGKKASDTLSFSDPVILQKEPFLIVPSLITSLQNENNFTFFHCDQVRTLKKVLHHDPVRIEKFALFRFKNSTPTTIQNHLIII